jgi:hypothetical protein
MHLPSTGGVAIKETSMKNKQVKSVTITKVVQEPKTESGIRRQVTLTMVPSTPKEGKSQASNQALQATETPAVQDEDTETELVILLDKYIVEADFLDEIESQFIDIYPALLEDVDYTPAELVGEIYWANLTDAGKRLAILSLKHLATEGDVPLVDVTCDDYGITSFLIIQVRGK